MHLPMLIPMGKREIGNPLDLTSHMLPSMGDISSITIDSGYELIISLMHVFLLYGRAFFLFDSHCKPKGGKFDITLIKNVKSPWGCLPPRGPKSTEALDKIPKWDHINNQ